MAGDHGSVLSSHPNMLHQQRLGSGTYSATQLGSVLTVRATGIDASGIQATASLGLNPNFMERPTFYLYVDEVDPELLNLLSLTASATFVSEKIVAEVAIFDADTGLPDHANAAPKTLEVKLLKVGQDQ